MRFNVKEIKELAAQHKCEKEGNLFFREKQESFFRRTEGMKIRADDLNLQETIIFSPFLIFFLTFYYV
jgi:hypothetical protein